MIFILEWPRSSLTISIGTSLYNKIVDAKVFLAVWCVTRLSIFAITAMSFKYRLNFWLDNDGNILSEVVLCRYLFVISSASGKSGTTNSFNVFALLIAKNGHSIPPTAG